MIKSAAEFAVIDCYQKFIYWHGLFIFRVYNLKREDDLRVTSLGRRSVIFWVTAVLCWINDRLYCEAWSSIGFPYLHGIWHVLIFIAAYTAVVLFAYFDVKQNHPHERPIIQYWPRESFELGIPYVQLKSYHLNKKEHTIWFCHPLIYIYSGLVIPVRAQYNVPNFCLNDELSWVGCLLTNSMRSVNFEIMVA